MPAGTPALLSDFLIPYVFHRRGRPKILGPRLTIMKKVLYFPIVRGARVGVLPCRRPAICLIVNEVRLVTNTG